MQWHVKVWLKGPHTSVDPTFQFFTTSLDAIYYYVKDRLPLGAEPSLENIRFIKIEPVPDATK